MFLFAALPALAYLVEAATNSNVMCSWWKNQIDQFPVDFIALEWHTHNPSLVKEGSAVLVDIYGGAVHPTCSPVETSTQLGCLPTRTRSF